MYTQFQDTLFWLDFTEMEKKFVSRPIHHQVYSMLQWLQISEDLIRNILAFKQKLTKSKFQHRITDSFLDDDVNIQLLKDFFCDEDFKFFNKTILNKKKASVYHCGVCSSTHNEDWVQCDSCLLWIHQSCILDENVLIESFMDKDWFCDNCKKN